MNWNGGKGEFDGDGHDDSRQKGFMVFFLTENSRNHVYSEVNLRGARENPALTSEPAPIRPGTSATLPVSLRTTPNLPWRPPPKHPNATTRAESSVQVCHHHILT